MSHPLEEPYAVTVFQLISQCWNEIQASSINPNQMRKSNKMQQGVPDSLCAPQRLS